MIWSSTSKRRNRNDMEYELLDTGIFNDDRYFDVFVEYAKESPEDMLIQITVCESRAGAGHAPCSADAVVPEHLDLVAGTAKPSLQQVDGREGAQVVAASHPELGERYLYCEGAPRFCSPKTKRITSASSARPIARRM